MHNSISISAHLFVILNQIIPNKEQKTKKNPTLLTVKIKSQKLSRNQTQTLNWHDKNRALVVFNDVILKVFLLKGSFKQCKFYANIFFFKTVELLFWEVYQHPFKKSRVCIISISLIMNNTMTKICRKHQLGASKQKLNSYNQILKSRLQLTETPNITRNLVTV